MHARRAAHAVSRLRWVTRGGLGPSTQASRRQVGGTPGGLQVGRPRDDSRAPLPAGLRAAAAASVRARLHHGVGAFDLPTGRHIIGPIWPCCIRAMCSAWCGHGQVPVAPSGLHGQAWASCWWGHGQGPVASSDWHGQAAGFFSSGAAWAVVPEPPVPEGIPTAPVGGTGWPACSCAPTPAGAPGTGLSPVTGVVSSSPKGGWGGTCAPAPSGTASSHRDTASSGTRMGQPPFASEAGAAPRREEAAHRESSRRAPPRPVTRASASAASARWR